MSLADLSERATGYEPLASNIVYLAEYGEIASAERAIAKFMEIRTLSTLSPTEALLIAGCPDACLAVSEDRELEIAKLVADYFAADRGEYIARNMLGALNRLVALLNQLDEGGLAWCVTWCVTWGVLPPI